MATVLVALASMGSPLVGCARVDLRTGMSRVQRAWVPVFDHVEGGRREELPTALADLRSALRDPRILENPLYREDASFRAFHDECLEGVDELESVTRSTADLVYARSSLSQRCTACHDVYKPRAPR